MADRPWHKRFHGDAITGYMGLTLEERGAYTTILDYLYDRRAPLQPNLRLLAGYMDVSVRKAEAMVESLIAKGKLYRLADGSISNKRFEKEVENSAKTSDLKAEIGSAGGRKTAEKKKSPNENNGDLLANVKQASSYVRSQRPEEEEQEKKKPVTSTPTPSAPGKATKVGLPEGFPHLDAKNAAIMHWQKKGRPDLAATVDDQADQFRDHHTAHGGKMIDWGAAWRTWVRNALEMTRPPRPGQAPTAPPVPEIASVDQWRDRLKKFAFGIEDTGISPGHPPGYWHHSFGEARPLEPGCKCPPAVLAQFEQQHPGALAAATKALARRAGGAGGR